MFREIWYQSISIKCASHFRTGHLLWNLRGANALVHCYTNVCTIGARNLNKAKHLTRRRHLFTIILFCQNIYYKLTILLILIHNKQNQLTEFSLEIIHNKQNKLTEFSLEIIVLKTVKVDFGGHCCIIIERSRNTIHMFKIIC